MNKIVIHLLRMYDWLIRRVATWLCAQAVRFFLLLVFHWPALSQGQFNTCGLAFLLAVC